MFYVLELGEIEQNLVKQAIREGQPIPERIANRPTIEPGSELYLQAFFDLDSERSHQYNYTSIPFLAIVNYASYLGVDAETADDLVYYVREIDREHIERLKKKEPNRNG